MNPRPVDLLKIQHSIFGSKNNNKYYIYIQLYVNYLWWKIFFFKIYNMSHSNFLGITFLTHRRNSWQSEKCNLKKNKKNSGWFFDKIISINEWNAEVLLYLLVLLVLLLAEQIYQKIIEKHKPLWIIQLILYIFRESGLWGKAVQTIWTLK